MRNDDLIKQITTAMDYLDPFYKQVEKLNNRMRFGKPVPLERYHLNDGDKPEVVDIYEKYPNQKFKLIYQNGYVYVGNEEGERFFMSMHCMSNSKEVVEDYIEHLQKIRGKR